MSIFTGSCTAMVTPFTENGINFDSLGKCIEFQIDQGTDALLACGTTGEPSTMIKEEKKDLISYTVEKVQGRIPLIAGTGGNNTKEVIRASVEAESLGVDALLIVNPYYNKTNKRGLYEHYKAICSETSLPVILYNVPSRTGCNISAADLEYLASIENIQAIKEASGNLAQVVEMAALCGDYIDIYSGNDDIIVPVLACGGKGVISVAANIIPSDVHNMVADFLSGNMEKSLETQLRAFPLIKALFTEVNPIPVKTAMNLMGMNMGPLRAPLYEISDQALSTLTSSMKEYGLI